ncbi:hypothetical protein GEMRC1_005772 [Eukaryota sp. GEM-RC1]
MSSKPLLLEYVPKLDSKYLTGGVLYISSDGSVYFIPLEDIDNSCTDVRQLSNFTVCSFPIELQSSYLLETLQFSITGPIRVQFSHKYRLLLVMGVDVHNCPGFTVYFLSSAPSLLKLFQDSLFPYTDISLAQSHPGIAYILNSSPFLLHFLHLPPYFSDSPVLHKPVGPLLVAGPCAGSLGHVVRMTRVTCLGDSYWQFITWNDECWGEFQLWSFDCLDPNHKPIDDSHHVSWSTQSLFLYLPFMSFPLPAQTHIENLSKPEPLDEDFSRIYINEIVGCPNSDLVAFLVRRDTMRAKSGSFQEFV